MCGFSATRFVGWYNGHPEDRELEPDLKVERATVVGAGNVAIDVFRFLASPHSRMAVTDASDHSLDALKESTVKEVDVLVSKLKRWHVDNVVELCAQAQYRMRDGNGQRQSGQHVGDAQADLGG